MSAKRLTEEQQSHLMAVIEDAKLGPQRGSVVFGESDAELLGLSVNQHTGTRRMSTNFAEAAVLITLAPDRGRPSRD